MKNQIIIHLIGNDPKYVIRLPMRDTDEQGTMFQKKLKIIIKQSKGEVDKALKVANGNSPLFATHAFINLVSGILNWTEDKIDKHGQHTGLMKILDNAKLSLKRLGYSGTVKDMLQILIPSQYQYASKPIADIWGKGKGGEINELIDSLKRINTKTLEGYESIASTLRSILGALEYYRITRDEKTKTDLIVEGIECEDFLCNPLQNAEKKYDYRNDTHKMDYDRLKSIYEGLELEQFVYNLAVTKIGEYFDKITTYLNKNDIRQMVYRWKTLPSKVDLETVKTWIAVKYQNPDGDGDSKADSSLVGVYVRINDQFIILVAAKDDYLYFKDFDLRRPYSGGLFFRLIRMPLNDAT